VCRWLSVYKPGTGGLFCNAKMGPGALPLNSKKINQECWLMLLGFPLDYCNNDSIQNALASFERMIGASG
jgi:hypothetical protein